MIHIFSLQIDISTINVQPSTTISRGSAFLSIEYQTVVISVVPMVIHLPPLTTVSACVPTIPATLLPPMNRVVTSVSGIRSISVVDMRSTLFTILQVPILAKQNFQYLSIVFFS